MQKVLNLYKQVGETPLRCIERWRQENPAYRNVKMTYAGRLDPLAEGVLIVLAGDEVKRKDDYLCLRKRYQVSAIIGFSSDTYDILGLVENAKAEGSAQLPSILGALQSFVGTFEQTYPIFSSKTVGGKPLFQWAREGRITEVVIPSRQVSIYSIAFMRSEVWTKEDVLNNVTQKIAMVSGDFRQEEALESWCSAILTSDRDSFSVVHFSVECSSGTYMRGIVHDLGRALGTSALTFGIKRTSVGNYVIVEE